MPYLVGLACPFADHRSRLPLATVTEAAARGDALPCPKCGAPIEVGMKLDTSVHIPRLAIAGKTPPRVPTFSVGNMSVDIVVVSAERK